MKNGVAVVVVAGALLFSTGGSTLAGGSYGSVGGGSDGFQLAYPERAQGAAVAGDVIHPVVLGAKVGGGSDRPIALGGKIAMGGGDN